MRLHSAMMHEGTSMAQHPQRAVYRIETRA